MEDISETNMVDSSSSNRFDEDRSALQDGLTETESLIVTSPPEMLTIPQALRSVGRLLIPYILIGGVATGAGFANIIFISRLGKNDLAASGLIYSTQTFLISPLQMALYASASQIGEEYGRNDFDAIGSLVQQAMVYASLLSIPAIILMFFSGSIFESLGQNSEVAFLAQDYFRIATIGVPISLWNNVAVEFLLGINRPFPMLLTNILSTGGVTALTALLVPVLGLRGWALAGVIAPALSFASLTLYLRLRSEYSKFSLFKLRIRETRNKLWLLFKVGLPVGLQMGAETLINEVYTLMVGRISVDSLIIRQIAFQYNFFFIFPITATAQVAGTVISQFSGQKNFRAARKVGHMTLLACIGMGSVGLILFCAGPRLLLATFPGGENLLDVARSAFIINGISLVTLAARQNLGGMLRGFSDTQYTFFTSCIGLGLVGIPLALVLGFLLGFNLDGMLSAEMIGSLLVVALLINRWKDSITPAIQSGEYVQPTSYAGSLYESAITFFRYGSRGLTSEDEVSLDSNSYHGAPNFNSIPPDLMH